MKKADITLVVSWVFAAAATFFYCCTLWFKMKLPYYYPVEHVWTLGKKADGIAQGWYGKGLFALPAAAVVALIVWAVLRAVAEKDLSPAAVKAVGLAATAVTVACMGCILYYEFHKWRIF